MVDQFPDKERIVTLERLKSKEWANCKKCDWFYKTSVLDMCPMCHHEWRKYLSYEQPQYESPSLE